MSNNYNRSPSSNKGNSIKEYKHPFNKDKKPYKQGNKGFKRPKEKVNNLELNLQPIKGKEKVTFTITYQTNQPLEEDN